MSTSNPMTIGKHEWRMRDMGKGVFDYEWRRAGQTIMGRFYPPSDIWKSPCDWPSFDFNNGGTLGLPKTLKKLWQREREFVASVKAAKAS